MTTKKLWSSVIAGLLTFGLLSSCEEEFFQDKENLTTNPATGSAGDNGPISDSTMLAYYPLDGNGEDKSGYGNHATITKGSFSADLSGNENGSFFLSEKEDVLDIPDFDQEKISVSLWYYYEGTGSFWNTLLYGNSSKHHLIISHENGSGEAGEIGTYGPSFNGSSYALQLNQWHHIVLTKDAKKSKIYLNGLLIYDSLDFSNKEYPLTVIGNFSAENGTQGSLGRLDEIKIFNKVLSPDEVNTLKGEVELETPVSLDQESVKTPIGLVAHFPLDNDTQDKSGNQRHATATGGAFGTDRFGNENAAFVIREKNEALDLEDFGSRQMSVSIWYYYDGTASFWNTLLYGKDSRHYLLVNHSDSYGQKNELGIYANGFEGSGKVLEQKKWYHIVLLKDSSSSKLYVDKTLVKENQDFSSEAYPLSVIGNFSSSQGTQGALGKLDEVRIYDVLLTEEEINELYGEPFEQESPEVITEPIGLIAHYPLDANTADISGFENDAAAIGGEYANDRFGNPYSAFRITAKDDALDVQDFAQEKISVSLWYYYEGTGSFWNTLLYGNSSKHHLVISHANGGGTAGEVGTYASGFTGSEVALETYKWYHLVLTKDGSQTQIYLDKQLIFTADDFSNAAYPLTVIGNFSALNGTQGALGRLDDVRIYDKILNETEIIELHGAPFTQEAPPTTEEPVQEGNTNTDGLLAYYPFSNNTQDASGNGNDATSVGGGFGTDRQGNPISAFVIAAKSDALDIADINSEQISVSMWYYYEGTGSFWNTLLYGSSSKHHLIVSHANGGGTAGEIGTYASGFNGSDVVLQVNQWYHLVLIKNGSSTQLYVNNQLSYSVQDFSNSQYPLTVIGNYTANGGTQGALGKLDEIRIYNKALSTEEVNMLFLQ